MSMDYVYGLCLGVVQIGTIIQFTDTSHLLLRRTIVLICKKYFWAEISMISFLDFYINFKLSSNLSEMLLLDRV